MQRPDQTHLHIIESSELPTFWREERLPTPLEQADNLILLIGDNQSAPSAWADLNASAMAAMLGMPVSGEGNDIGGWSWLHSQLASKNLYRLHPSPPAGGTVRAMLEMAGWEKYEVLKKQRSDSRTAFMALKFGQATVDRTRPAVSRTGFELRLLTDQQALD